MTTGTWHHHPLVKTPRRIVGMLLTAAAFAIPVYAFVQAGKPTAPGRSDPPSVTAVAMDIPSYHDAVPVLIYHDIANRPGRFVVTPEHFAQQMATLKRSGFHSITVAQWLAFMQHGTRLPDKPLLITFDDGLGSFWRNADPILAKYGFHAVVFVISGQIGHHGFYYMHPDELRSIVRSGRWDVEAHTHLAHNYIPVDSAGHYGPALANRMWLPRLNRVETREEYTFRIINDLNLNIQELRSYGANPLLFAYPFSAVGVPSNDPTVFKILDRLVAQRFTASFVDNAGQRFINRYDTPQPHRLPRLEVYQATTAERLLGRLRVLVPIPPRVSAMPTTGWFNAATYRGLSNMVTHGVLTVHSPHQKWFATYWAPSSTELWQHYKVSVTANHLGTQDRYASAATLLVGDSVFRGYAITVSAGRLAIKREDLHSRHPHYLEHGVLVPASHHRIVAELGHGSLLVAVDGHVMAKLPAPPEVHGDIGFGTWHPSPRGTIPTFSNLSVS